MPLTNNSPDNFDAIIIGGGPAGLTAAIFAAKRGRKIALLEKNQSCGTKILASGGGHCNIGNTASTEDFCAALGRSGRFAFHADKSFQEIAEQFFRNIGIELYSPDSFHLFPKSRKSSDVLSALLAEIQRSGVKIFHSCKVEKIIIESGRIKGVSTDIGNFIAPKILLSCGGASWKAANGFNGYALAKFAGHNITEICPALVELYCAEKWIKKLTGISLPSVKISVPRKKIPSVKGEMLFTHRGISGPAALNISGEICELLNKEINLKIKINLLDEKPINWAAKFAEWREKAGKKRVCNLIREYLPAAIAESLCELAAAKFAEASRLSADSRDALISWLSDGIELNVNGSAGLEKAMLAKGGVDIKEVDAKTMQSRLLEGLFFAGEILDIQGPCGGYNMRWAFASGCLAGQNL